MYYLAAILILLVGLLLYKIGGFNITGIKMSSFESDVIVTVIGSMIAIFGSVLIQMATEKRKENSVNDRNGALMKKELKNNFMVCLYRISNLSDEIPYFTEVFDNLITQEHAHSFRYKARGGKENDLVSELYFLVKRGEYGLKTFKEFYNNTFKLQKKEPGDFNELKAIIESVGIDEIYEFSILKHIIALDRLCKIEAGLPFDDFKEVFRHKRSGGGSLEEDISDYITELVCRKFFGNECRVYCMEEAFK